MWRHTRLRRFVGLIYFGFFVGGVCGSLADSLPRETPSAPRLFQPYSQDRWIGNAVAYGPHRDGQHPDGPSPTADQLRQDLQLMVPHWNMVRTYGSSGCAQTFLSVIRDGGFDMKVMLGVWIAPESPQANAREIDAAIKLAAEYPDIIVAVCVGNETQVDWSTHRSPLDDLIEYVRRVRAHVKVPVTVADDYNFWNKPESQTLAPEIDFITMHAHPMWNGLQLENALAWLQDQVTAIQTLHPDSHIVLGETGWATSVHTEGEQARLIKGRPGQQEQKQFYEAVRAWAKAEKLTTFFFEAFDEKWKGGNHPNEVEKHWGLFKSDRTPKAALADLHH